MALLVFTALIVVTATVVMHGIGTTQWLQFLARSQSDSQGLLLPGRRLLILVLSATLMISLHLLEIMLWALVYRLVAPDELVSLESAAYFSAVTFTTLGYGDITLSSQWRLLSGFEAIDGIVLIGWTTAFLFAVLQRSWGAIGVRSEKTEARHANS